MSSALKSAYRESRQAATERAFEDAPKGGFMEFVSTFSRDPAVLDALRLAAASNERRQPVSPQQYSLLDEQQLSFSIIPNANGRV